jgi:hypothetical protein
MIQAAQVRPERSELEVAFEHGEQPRLLCQKRGAVPPPSGGG